MGLATHYIPPEAINNVLYQIESLDNPTLAKLSSIIASHAPEQALPHPTSSKTNPDSPSPIKGEIRELLDQAFGKSTLEEVYETLLAAEGDPDLSQEVQEWAKIQKELMNVRSPSGMAVALEGYKWAKQAKRLDTTLRNSTSAVFRIEC